jgi:sugar phosphate permease
MGSERSGEENFGGIFEDRAFVRETEVINRVGFKVHWAWVVLGSSFLTLFVTYSIRIGAYSVLLPEMIKDLKMMKAQAGMIKSAFSITYLLFAPLMGWLTDRIGGRKVISIFCLFLGGGAFLMGQAGSLTSSAFFFALVGVGAAAMWVPVVTLIQSWFGTRRRGLALGILSTSYGIGFGLMGLVLPVVVMRYNWRFGWFGLGLAGLALILLNGTLLRDQPEDIGLSPWGGGVEREKIISSKEMSSIEILREGRFWIIAISYLAIAYGTYAMVDFIVTYGAVELQIPYRVASLFITVIAFSGVIGGLLLMAVSDYLGRKNSLLIIQTLVAVSALFVIFGGKRLPLLMAGMGCFGFFYGPIFPMYAACARDYFPKEVAGTVLGLLTIFYGVGMMISPVLTGYLADVTGTFRWSFVLAAFASFMASLLIGFLRKPREFGNEGH